MSSRHGNGAFIVGSLLLSLCAQAQPSQPTSVTEMMVPDSPAFVVLGATPTEIQRPTTLKELGITIGQSFTDGTSLAIPEDFALEITPYWLFGGGRDLTYQEWASRSWFNPANLSVSVATADVPGSTTLHSRRLGVGLRWGLYFASAEAACKASMNGPIATVQGKYDALRLGLPNGGADITPAEEEKLWEQAVRESGVDLAAATKACLPGMGFRWDLALAAVVGFEPGSVEAQAVPTAAVWTTLGYVTDAHDGLFVARWYGDGLHEDQATHLIDLGAKYLYRGDAYALSLEAIVRIPASEGGGEAQYKVDAHVEARLTDFLWAGVTLGQDYTTFTSKGGLLALASVRIGVGNPVLSTKPTN